jgi:hypothetical protein
MTNNNVNVPSLSSAFGVGGSGDWRELIKFSYDKLELNNLFVDFAAFSHATQFIKKFVGIPAKTLSTN